MTPLGTVSVFAQSWGNMSSPFSPPIPPPPLLSHHYMNLDQLCQDLMHFYVQVSLGTCFPMRGSILSRGSAVVERRGVRGTKNEDNVLKSVLAFST